MRLSEYKRKQWRQKLINVDGTINKNILPPDGYHLMQNKTGNWRLAFSNSSTTPIETTTPIDIQESTMVVKPTISCETPIEKDVEMSIETPGEVVDDSQIEKDVETPVEIVVEKNIKTPVEEELSEIDEGLMNLFTDMQNNIVKRLKTTIKKHTRKQTKKHMVSSLKKIQLPKYNANNRLKFNTSFPDWAK